MQKKKFPTEIVTKRLVLKKYKLSMATEMFNALNSDRKRLGKFLSFISATKTLADEKRHITSTNEKWRKAEQFFYSIFEKSSNRYMGNIGVHTINWAHDCCEIGYWIHGDFEGHGYVSEAVTALTSCCYKKGFHRLEIRCQPENVRSIAVAKRCGFIYEACLKENRIMGKTYRDTLVFGKLKPRRQKMKNAGDKA